MPEQPDWTIVFYLSPTGDSPVEQFLRGLDRKTYNRFLWSIEQLRVRNVQAREPLVKHLEGKLYELRRESTTNIYRILYAFLSGRRILLLHGFQKKTHRTPRQEIELALRRLEDILAEEGGEGR
jgi:phage-related protein